MLFRFLVFLGFFSCMHPSLKLHCKCVETFINENLLQTFDYEKPVNFVLRPSSTSQIDVSFVPILSLARINEAISSKRNYKLELICGWSCSAVT